MGLSKKKIGLASAIWTVLFIWLFSLYNFERQRCLAPLLKLKNCRLNQALDHQAEDIYFAEGWSYPERDFRWSEAVRATFYFKLESPVENDFIALKMEFAGANGPQTAEIFCNDQRLGKITLQLKPKNVIFKIKKALLAQDGINKIQFFIPDAQKPDNGDPRCLGLMITRIYILI